MNINMNKLVLVDENDNVIGTEDKMFVHQAGMLHRAFSIFLFRQTNNNLQLLLQKRHINKYHSGGLWTNSCCGHPLINEDIIFAANRRLKEELGIDVKLYYLDHFIYKSQINSGSLISLTEHELDHVLIGIYQDLKVVLDPNEVDEIKWINIEEFEMELLNFPNNFTVWLSLAWAVVKKNLLFINKLLEVVI